VVWHGLRRLWTLLRIAAGVISRPASGHYRNHLDPRALRSRRVMLSLPSTLLRPDPPVSAAPPDFPRTLVIQEALPDDLVWAAAETFPTLGQHSVHACHHLYAGRRNRSLSPMRPCSYRLPHCLNESAPPTIPTSASVGPRSRRLPSVFDLLRPARLLALLDRSDLETRLRPPRTFYPSFPSGRSPSP